MTRDRDTVGADRAPHPNGVPSCDTGPAGQVAFVARELADLWRELRGSTTGKARPTPDPDTNKDAEKDIDK
ncbi:MAG: hypothetical protein ACTHK1_16395 [Actinomycetales bacterium]